MSKEIKFFMLSNGDKIIGRIEKKEDILIVEKPIILRDVILADGVSIIPLKYPTKDECIEVSISSVAIHPSTPNEEVSDFYVKLTSNLVLPK